MAFRMTGADDNGDVRIAVAGELDLASAPELEAELLRRLADAALGDIRLDLREVTFIDSSGLRTLLLASREAAARGRRLRIATGDGQVLRVITLAGVADRLDLAGG